MSATFSSSLGNPLSEPNMGDILGRSLGAMKPLISVYEFQVSFVHVKKNIKSVGKGGNTSTWPSDLGD